MFRRIETLPFSRESSDLFDRPSINLARIVGGDAFNKVPDRCCDGRRHPLPAQPGPGRDPRPDPRDRRHRDRQVLHARAGDRLAHATRTCSRCATRVGALDRGRGAERRPRRRLATRSSFLEAGIPAVEFGPIGGGHHGPEEWVSIASLRRYRQALGDFVARLPALRCERGRGRRPARGRGRPGVSRRGGAPRRARAGRWPAAARALGGAARSSLLTAAATATAGLLAGQGRRRARSTASARRTSPTSSITAPRPGKPQTILLLGSDRRFDESSEQPAAQEATPARSDTMMLIRLDPRPGGDDGAVDPARPQGR